VPWRTIRGKKVWIEPKNKRPDITMPPDPHKATTSSPLIDEINRKRRADHARKIKEDHDKRQKQTEKKHTPFGKPINLNLGYAKGVLIKTTPILVQLDPTLSSIYTSYKIGKYGYCFLKQVNDDYKTSGNFEESLKTITAKEIEEKITSKIKFIPLEKSSQYAANMIWSLGKQIFSQEAMDPKWDSFAENALAKTFEEIGGKLL
jgi:hypothetical protein